MSALRTKTIKLIATKHFEIEMLHLTTDKYVVRYLTSTGEHYMPELPEYEMASTMFDIKFEQLDAIYAKATKDLINVQ